MVWIDPKPKQPQSFSHLSSINKKNIHRHTTTFQCDSNCTDRENQAIHEKHNQRNQMKKKKRCKNKIFSVKKNLTI